MSAFRLSQRWRSILTLGLVLALTSACQTDRRQRRRRVSNPYARRDRVAPAAPVVTVTRLAPLRFPSVQRLANADSSLRKQLRNLTALTTMVDAGLREVKLSRLLCVTADQTPREQRQQRIDALASFAAQTSALLLPQLTATYDRMMASSPAMVDYEAIMMRGWTLPSRNAVLEGLYWWLAEAGAQVSCQRSAAAGSRALLRRDQALAFVHLVSSSARLRDVVFDAYVRPPAAVDENFAWSVQRHAVGVVVTAVLSLTSSSQKARTPAFLLSSTGYKSQSLRLKFSRGGVPVDCDAAVTYRDAINPMVTEFGGLLPVDTRFVVDLKCRNTSTERVMSESFIPSRPAHRCVYEPNQEIVLPELEPDEEATVSIGPLFVSEECGDFSLGYQLVSSQYRRPNHIELSVKPIRAHLSLTIDRAEEDLAGDSKTDSGKVGLWNGDQLELHLSVLTGKNYSIKLQSLELLRPSAAWAIKIRAQYPLGFTALGGKGRYLAEDDLDLVVSGGAVWNAFRTAWKEETKAIQSTLVYDLNSAWGQAKMDFGPTCVAAAKAMGGEIGPAYAEICDVVFFSTFKRMLLGLRKAKCAVVQNRGAPVKDAAGGPPRVPYWMLLDPSYDHIVAAARSLSELGLLNAPQLGTTSRYLDRLLYTPLYKNASAESKVLRESRALGRKLIVASILARFVNDTLGPDHVRRYVGPLLAGVKGQQGQGMAKAQEQEATYILKLQDRLAAAAIEGEVLRLERQSAEKSAALGQALEALKLFYGQSFQKKIGGLVDQTIGEDGCNADPVFPDYATPPRFRVRRLLRLPFESPPG